jgi:hypothetical protein
MNLSGATALEQFAAAAAWGAGVGAFGAGAGGVTGLICGSHLARSFHGVFVAALIWLAAVGTLVAMTSFRLQLGMTYDAFERFNVPAGAAAVLLGAVTGTLLGWRSDGFTRRARKRAAWLTATGIAFGLAVMAYAIQSASPAVPPINQWIIPAMTFVAICATAGGMIGALAGADRPGEREGFAVMATPQVVTPLPPDAATRP